MLTVDCGLGIVSPTNCSICGERIRYHSAFGQRAHETPICDKVAWLGLGWVVWVTDDWTGQGTVLSCTW